MKYFYNRDFYNYFIILFWLSLFSLTVKAQALMPGVYDWESFPVTVHATSTNTVPATWEIGNGFTAVTTGNGNGSQIRVLIGNSLSTKVLRYDALAGAQAISAILKSTSGADFGIKQFNIWPSQNEAQLLAIYVKRDGVTIDTIQPYYQPTTPIHKITISANDYPFLANIDELEIFNFSAGIMLDDIEVVINQAPIAIDDAVTVTEDIPATGNVLTNDSDPEGNALTASLVTAPVNGTVVLNADGSFTYTPNTNYNGLDSLIYQVCDNGTPSLCDTAVLRFTVTAINEAPIAVDDAVTVTEDVPATGNVLTNDSDPEGNALTASLVTAPVNGTVVLNADGSFTYTPNANYDGLDSLIYQVCDNGMPSLCDTAWVHFSVEAINDDPTFAGLPVSITIDEDESPAYLRNALSDGIFADVDARNNEVSLTLHVDMGVIVFAANGGIPITISGNGSSTAVITGTATAIESYININSNIAYLPEKNATDPVTVSLSANDNGHMGTGGGGDVALGSFIININAINDAPEGVDDEAEVEGGTPLSGNVLTNDSDPEGDALTASLVTAPVNGTVVLNANGSFTYTPNANFSGLDSLIYQVCDNGTPSLCDTATVRFTVTANTPLPCGWAMTQNSGTSGPCVLCSVTNPGQAVDADKDTYSRIQIPVGLNAGEVFQILTFTTVSTTNEVFRVGLSADMPLTDANLLKGLTLTFYNGDTQVAQYGDVTALDLDAANGENPAELYVAPGAAFDRVRIALVAANADLRSIRIHYARIAPPIAVLDQTQIDIYEGGTATFTVPDPVPGLTYRWYSESNDLLYTGSSFTTPVLADTTTYYVETVNAAGCASRIPVEVRILPPAPPALTTSAGTSTFTESVDGNPVSIAIDDVLTIVDPDNNTLVSATVMITDNFQSEDILAFVNDGTTMGNITGLYDATTGTLTLTSAGGTATLAQWQVALRSVTYSNDSRNPNTTDRTVSFQANDGTNNSNLATKTVAVVAVNTQPSAVDDEVEVQEDMPATGNVLTNDSDPESNALTASLVTAPVNGTVVLNADGSFTYTPNANYNGLDSLIYQVCDNGIPSRCDTARVRFTINAINDAPVAVDDEIILTENTPARGNVLTNDNDPEGNALTASLVTAPVNGTVVLNADGSFTYTPTANLIGLDSLLYQVCDNGTPSKCDTAIVRFVINAGNPRINTVNTTTSNGLYKLGDEINIALVFNQVVTVQPSGATPLLALNTGSLSRDADYVSGSGSDVLMFKYTVQEGDTSADLDYLSTTALKPNGARIRNDALLDAELALPTVGGANSLAGKYDIAVDGIAPLSTSVVVPSNGYYRTDDSLTFTVNFNEPVVVGSTGAGPYLSVTIGETVVQAPYVTGSGTNALTFTYMVQNGDLDLDGIALNGSTGNNETIHDAAGNQAFATLNGVPSTAGIFVNTRQPSVTLSTTANSPVNGPFTVTATFSEAVTGFTLGDIVANNATLSNLQTANNISYSFLVTPSVGGTIQAAIPAGVAVNIGNNGNIASNILSIQYTTTITGVTLEDSSFVYDGTVKSLAVTGTLPEGTTVSYVNNERTNVGTQEVTATISGANYEDLVLRANLSITKAVITGVTLEDSSYVYDGTVKSLAISGTLPEGTTVSYVNNERTNVGRQELTATVSGGNYTDLVLTANLSITEATITGVTLEDSSFVYDGSVKSLAVTGTLPDGTSVSYANNERTNVGGQEVTATVSGGNYTDLVLTANLSITEATITGVTFEDSSFVYDGSVKSLAVTGTLPDGTSVSYANNERTNVGTQEVTATISGANYTDLVLRANLSITKATITGVTLEDSSFVYDGTAKSLGIAGTLPAGTTVSYVNNERTNVGGQEVTATVSGANYEDLVLTADLSITKAIITGVTLEDSSFVYDGTAKSLTIAGTLLAGTAVSYANNSRTDVGTQEVTATVSGANYTDLVLTANLSITKATITGVTLEDSSFVYDGTAKSLAISGTLPDGTSVSYANNERTNIGTQEVTATVSGANYKDLVLTANLSITKATITGVTLEDSSFVYDGTVKSLAISGTLPEGTTVSYANNERTNVGGQEVTATISGGNYADLVLTANLSITKATITGVTLEDSSFVYDGTAKSLAVTGTLPDGTSVSYANNERTNIGTQEVTATVSGANYKDLVLRANLSITKAVITGVTLEDSSFVYDGTVKSLAVTGTLPEGTTVSYVNNERTNVGGQEVTATVSGANYKDLVLTANLSIAKATITGVTLEDSSFVYDGTAKSLSIDGTLPEGTTVNYDNNSRTDVGTQEVTATVSGENYTQLILKANLNVRPVERSIDFAALPEKTYGDSDFDAHATTNSGELISYSSSNTGVATISAGGRIHIIGAGETIITATVPENVNYNNKPTVSRKLIVKKAAQEISFAELGEVARDAGSVPLVVSASSSLAVKLEVNDPQVATISGTNLTILRLGTVTVTAYQDGDANYEAASPVSITVRVKDDVEELPIRVHKALSPNGDGINEFLMIEGIKDYPDNKLTIVDRNGMTIIEMEGYNNEDKVFRGFGPGNNPIPTGTYYYLLEVKIDGSWKYKKGYFVVRY
ncbi:Ig-like domain-containing protein [Olivibacter domesticus]|uniref:Ig-like domain-containing protein n=1 Tax=Olivibacter domesticus TaxID=407022 RepID=UPI00360E4898